MENRAKGGKRSGGNKAFRDWRLNGRGEGGIIFVSSAVVFREDNALWEESQSWVQPTQKTWPGITVRNDSLLPICPRASTLFVQTLRGGGGGERERGCETKVSQNGSVTRKWGTVERLEIESDVISAWFFGSNFWGGLLSSSIFCDIDRVLFFLFWKFRSFLNPRSRRSHRWRWLSYMMARNFRYYILYIFSLLYSYVE